MAERAGTEQTGESPKAARTRERLLEAAVDLLPGALRQGLVHSLGPVPVSRRAGVSRQTWYRYWGGDADPFAEDLVRRLLHFSRGMAGVVSDGVARLVPEQNLMGVDAAREMARMSFYASVEPEFVLSRFMVFSLATEERILAEREGREVEGGLTAIVRDYFDSYTDELADAYRVILDGWGREPAPPFDVRDLAVVLTALVAGLSFRHVVDPDAAPADLGREVILLMAPALTRVKPGTADRGPTALFGSDQKPMREVHSAQRLAGQKRVERSRSAIITAARREFSLRGYSEVSITGIASAAGVSETTVYEHFWNKAGVARACYESEYRELASAVEADPADPITRIRNHIARLAGMLRAHPALAAAVLDAFGEADYPGEATDPRDPRLTAPLPLPLVGPIRDAKTAGLIRTDVRSFDIAIAITNLVMVYGRVNPHMSHEDVAVHVERVILDGVRRRAGREAQATPGI